MYCDRDPWHDLMYHSATRIVLFCSPLQNNDNLLSYSEDKFHSLKLSCFVTFPCKQSLREFRGTADAGNRMVPLMSPGIEFSELQIYQEHEKEKKAKKKSSLLIQLWVSLDQRLTTIAYQVQDFTHRMLEALSS